MHDKRSKSEQSKNSGVQFLFGDALARSTLMGEPSRNKHAHDVHRTSLPTKIILRIMAREQERMSQRSSQRMSESNAYGEQDEMAED